MTDDLTKPHTPACARLYRDDGLLCAETIDSYGWRYRHWFTPAGEFVRADLTIPADQVISFLDCVP